MCVAVCGYVGTPYYWTVQTHIARIYEKLHVHSRAQAVSKFTGRGN